MSRIIKVAIKNSVRRFPVQEEDSFRALSDFVAKLLHSRDFQLSFTDGEGDNCLIASDFELEDALRASQAAGEKYLKIHVGLNEAAAASPDPQVEVEARDGPIVAVPSPRPHPHPHPHPRSRSPRVSRKAAKPPKSASPARKHRSPKRTKDVEEKHDAPQPTTVEQPAEPAPKLHIGTSCATCGVEPIEGTRYKCLPCQLNFCEPCEALGQHPETHPMLKLKTVRTFASTEQRQKEKIFKRKGLPKAEFVSESTAVTGTLTTKCFQLRNCGYLAWPAGITARFVKGNLYESAESEFAPVAVKAAAPGEVVEVAVSFSNSPASEKRKGVFRLFTAETEPRKFGPKLWVEIEAEKKSKDKKDKKVVEAKAVDAEKKDKDNEKKDKEAKLLDKISGLEDKHKEKIEAMRAKLLKVREEAAQKKAQADDNEKSPKPFDKWFRKPRKLEPKPLAEDKPKPKKNPEPKPFVHAAQLQQLEALGFPSEEARAALLVAHGDVQTALNALLDGKM